MAISKRIKFTLLAFLALLLAFAGYLFIGSPPQAEEIAWGVNFSPKHAEALGLNWQENYLALLDDLKAKNIKLLTNWDLLEPEEQNYQFDYLDWQIREAESRGANILLVVGIKTGRWPECHVPEWAKGMDDNQQEEKALELVGNIISRYKNSEAIWGWQIENEPFFPFGECPKISKDFVEKETILARSLDDLHRPIVISDSGEWSFWTKAARMGDIVGITMYKKVWFDQLNVYFHYPFPPIYYCRRAKLVSALFDREVIVGELQGEPWGPQLLYDLPIEEQGKTMDSEKFVEMVDFAKRTGFDRFYLWGAEWWYWLKEKQDQPEIWEEARKILSD